MSRFTRNLQLSQLAAALQFGQKHPDRSQFNRREQAEDPDDENRSPITGKKLPSSAGEVKGESSGKREAENRADRNRR